MHGTPAASASGPTMSPLSLMAGPRMTSAPASTSSAKDFSTSKAVPPGSPWAWRATNSKGRSRRPGGRHLVDADADRFLEQRPVVGLGEVVEDTHEDRCRRAGRSWTWAPFDPIVSG